MTTEIPPTPQELLTADFPEVKSIPTPADMRQSARRRSQVLEDAKAKHRGTVRPVDSGSSTHPRLRVAEKKLP